MDFFNRRLWSIALFFDLVYLFLIVWTTGRISALLMIGLFLIANIPVMAMAIVVSGQNLNRWFLLGMWIMNLAALATMLLVVQFFITLVAAVFGFASFWALVPVALLGGFLIFFWNCQR